MIRSVFRDEGGRTRPFLTAFVVLPALDIEGDVAFLVDTGADGTALAPHDAINLGIDPASLPPGPPSTGVGGIMETVYVEATISLGQLTYPLTLRVLVPRGAAQQAALRRIPSLLGRDVLSHFALFMEERTNRVLLLEPDEADRLQLP